jgi:regulatory protein
MKITAIKAQIKSDERVSVFVDGKYSFSLNLDQLLQEKIKKNDEIDEIKIKQLKKLSDEGKLKQRALEWLMGRPHSERELRDYLYRKKADKDLIDNIIDEFIEKKYLNDENFARWFVELRRRKNKSTREITSELRSKGVSQVIVQTVISEDEKTDMESLKLLVIKLSSRSRYKDENKLKTYLASKGFNYSDIKDALSENN